LRVNFLDASLPYLTLWLRLGCVWLRIFQRVQTINEPDIPTREEMNVLVGGDLNRTVPHLIAHVGQRCPRFDQQAAEGVSKVMESKTPEVRALKRPQEVGFAQCADAREINDAGQKNPSLGNRNHA